MRILPEVKALLLCGLLIFVVGCGSGSGSGGQAVVQQQAQAAPQPVAEAAEPEPVATPSESAAPEQDAPVVVSVPSGPSAQSSLNTGDFFSVNNFRTPSALDLSNLPSPSVSSSADSNSQNISAPVQSSDSGSAPQAVGESSQAGSEEIAINFSVEDPAVDANSSTQLSWSVNNADSCQASGDWTGTKSQSGSESVSLVGEAKTFVLTCNNNNSSAMSMVTVEVFQNMALAWAAPTENSDGTPLQDLSGYRIYYGDSSRSYDNSVSISDPDETGLDLQIIPGTYYVAMTAVNAAGAESNYSNEIIRTLD